MLHQLDHMDKQQLIHLYHQECTRKDDQKKNELIMNLLDIIMYVPTFDIHDLIKHRANDLE